MRRLPLDHRIEVAIDALVLRQLRVDEAVVVIVLGDLTMRWVYELFGKLREVGCRDDDEAK